MAQHQHGTLGSLDWAPPTLACHSDFEARPGYDSCKAHEYLDTPEVLAAKVKVLAVLVKASSSCVAYTGAGISTAAGIADYASEAAREAGTSVTVGAAQAMLRSPMESAPTAAHCVLTAMHSAGYLKRWVQQNHDGLPQKAGYPQHALNEIHVSTSGRKKEEEAGGGTGHILIDCLWLQGAWFDPANPVVKMEGELRSDLFADLLQWEQQTDLCLAMGTSLAGMNADRIASTVADTAASGGLTSGGAPALGTVIVSLQQTALDAKASLRIFAKIDDVMTALADELAIAPATPPSFLGDLSHDAGLEEDVFRVPYSSDGERMPANFVEASTWPILDLREGKRVRIVSGVYAGDEGEVVGRSRHGHYQVRFLHTLTNRNGRAWKAPMTHTLGGWFATEAAAGLLERIPIESIPEDAGETEEQVMSDFHAGDVACSVQAEPPVVGAGSLPDWVKASFVEGKQAQGEGEEEGPMTPQQIPAPVDSPAA